jgi:hypothetical protein
LDFILSDGFHEQLAICVDGGENVDMSAELLTRAIEGESVDELQDKLLDIIKTACSTPTKKQRSHLAAAGLQSRISVASSFLF